MIEDSAELQIKGVPNLVRLEARNANVEGTGEITIRDLLKSSLRMRPSRIIVGEVRGSEAIDMLQSLNTGHCGASSGHSNSPQDMLSRLETMVLMGMDMPLPAIRRQIASGIDIIVHLGRLRDKSRKVLKVVEVLGYEDGEIQLQTLFEFQEKSMIDGRIKGEWVQLHEIQNKEKLLAQWTDCYHSKIPKRCDDDGRTFKKRVDQSGSGSFIGTTGNRQIQYLCKRRYGLWVRRRF